MIIKNYPTVIVIRKNEMRRIEPVIVIRKNEFKRIEPTTFTTMFKICSISTRLLTNSFLFFIL